MPGLSRSLTHWTAAQVRDALRLAPVVCRRAWADVRIGKLDSAAQGRVLIVTPKKTGSAPYRNLLKRRTRAIIGQELPHISPVVIMVYFKPYPEKLRFDQLQKFLSSCLRKYQLS